MSKKLGLNIGGRRFDVDVEDSFAPFLEKQLRKDFNVEGNNDLKILLQAYIRKNHELFTQEQKIEELVGKLDISY
ncbi:MAG: hypothetical protein QG559_55 [Campylobacterota bacterium]|nr:hypothetical protein [Campylobacterota bacterium]